MKVEKSSDVMWWPTEDSIEKSNMFCFMETVKHNLKIKIESYQDLWNWSVTEYDAFWELFWKFSKIKFSKPYTKVVNKETNMAAIPEWFHGSRLNYSENLLQGEEEDIAIYFLGEQRKLTTLTFGELKRNVARLATALRKTGVKSGDRVVGYIPNCPLAVEAMLATASLGAIWSSTSPEFGVSGVLDRFQQIQPKVIFSVDSVIYNDKQHDHLQKLTKVVKGLPELEKVVILPYVREESQIDKTGIKNCVFHSEFLSDIDEAPTLEFTQVPFNHPLFIMYSSGTTGPPKCMVHSVGGTLLQHMKEHILHANMKKDDVMLYYSTTGWMMWNWLVSALAIGASIVLYDGSPLMPKADILFDIIDQIGITVLGTGARWIEALEEKGLHPIKTHKLTSLHTILSTASPLKPASFDYVYNSIKKELLLGSITGGTDIISCFAGSNPILPVSRGEIQCRNLGMAIECWDEDGDAVMDTAGELVCKKPFPSMPIYFWNDDNNEKYQKSYFSKFKGVWNHRDYCELSSKTGGILMLGRSDGTLNPNGVRFGSAEIYNVVNAVNVPEILDSLCVGQNTENGERVILFVKMAEGSIFSEVFVKKVKALIREHLSARHTPEQILEVKDIPYTASGKKVEVAVKKILNGQDVQKRGALINPQSLDLYYNIPELKI